MAAVKASQPALVPHAATVVFRSYVFDMFNVDGRSFF
jgi:hypothetical protein